MRDVIRHRSGVEVDLAEPSPEGWALLASIRAARRTLRGEIRCGQHGGDLYLQDRGGALFACHWPGSGHAPHPVGMSPEHRRQVEYIARAAEREGLTAERERSLPTHVRPDLVVNRTAFEVQRSGITPTLAKARTTKAVRGGMDVSLWTSDKPSGTEPKWLRQGVVPAVRIHAAHWKGLPAPGMATVEGGLSRFASERHYGAHDARCLTKAGRCSGWRLRREPVTGVSLDRLSVGLVVGEYVPAAVAGSVHIVPAGTAAEFDLSWDVPRPAAPPGELDEATRVECQASAPATCCGERWAGWIGKPLVSACILCPKSISYWRRACR